MATKTKTFSKSKSRVPAVDFNLEIAKPILGEDDKQRRDEDNHLMWEYVTEHFVGQPRSDISVAEVGRLADNAEAMAALLREEDRERFIDAYEYLDIDQLQQVSEFLAEAYTSLPTKRSKRS